ncbi:MAG: hypothetical protein H7066_23395 [Cytophagaceae bacterium]|nr:hypothetical protein [Gemmatimonadaceae bacterium]
MSTDKDFKRVVRTRLQKTGESYTAARATLLRRPRATTRATEPPFDYSAKAGMRDAVIMEKTGKGWAEWLDVLDRAKAHEWTHTEIARHVSEAHGVPPWWTQAVTVGYERIKDLRARGQRRAGTWEAAKSRTFAAPVAEVFCAFHDPRRRATWLPGVKLTVRTATANKSLRITWPDGSSVQCYFTVKGPAKSSVAVQHVKLPDRAAVDRMKAMWAERLDALAERLLPTKRTTASR